MFLTEQTSLFPGREISFFSVHFVYKDQIVYQQDSSAAIPISHLSKGSEVYDLLRLVLR
jgi:hypothetical protein